MNAIRYLAVIALVLVVVSVPPAVTAADRSGRAEVATTKDSPEAVAPEEDTADKAAEGEGNVALECEIVEEELPGPDALEAVCDWDGFMSGEGCSSEEMCSALGVDEAACEELVAWLDEQVTELDELSMGLSVELSVDLPTELSVDLSTELSESAPVDSDELSEETVGGVAFCPGGYWNASGFFLRIGPVSFSPRVEATCNSSDAFAAGPMVCWNTDLEGYEEFPIIGFFAAFEGRIMILVPGPCIWVLTNVSS